MGKMKRAWEWAHELHKFTGEQLLTPLDPYGTGQLGFEELYPHSHTLQPLLLFARSVYEISVSN
eukprot:COSAG05_NODE_893_length_6708_cov_2.153427_1_plen_64_part_00